MLKAGSRGRELLVESGYLRGTVTVDEEAVDRLALMVDLVAAAAIEVVRAAPHLRQRQVGVHGTTW